MPPLAGLDTVLEPSPFPSRLAGPWAKGCRPPRRASDDLEVPELTPLFFAAMLSNGSPARI